MRASRFSEKSPANQEDAGKSSPSVQAIKRVTLLSDEITNEDHVSQFVQAEAKRFISSQEAFGLIGIMTLILLGTQLDSKEKPYLGYKVCLIIGFVSYIYLFPATLERKFRGELKALFAFRVLCSSVVYSVVFRKPLDYQFHSESQRNDCLSTVIFIMIASLFAQKDHTLVYWHIKMQFFIHALLWGVIIYYFRTIDLPAIGFEVAMIAALGTFYRFFRRRCEIESQKIKDSVTKQSRSIKEKLEDLKQNLEKQFNNPVEGFPVSKVDEIVMKIKYLKFRILQGDSEAKILTTKGNSIINRRLQNVNQKTITSYSSLVKPGAGVRSPRRSIFMELQRKPSHELESSSERASSPEGESDKEKSGKEPKYQFRLTPQDCDTILKLMLEKQAIAYYPDMLQNSELGNETAEFLRQHFTDQSNLLYEADAPQQFKAFNTFESKIFDFSPWSSYLEGNICQWNFDMIKLRDLTNGKHMVEFGCAIMKRFNILKTLNTDPTTVTNFLNDVGDGYLPNPYHNSMHGADVANAVGYLLSKNNFASNFSDLEIACVVISALVHDIGHPGVNNPFLIATKSPEAMIYNDQSPLENFHTASFYKILQKPESNILSKLSDKDYKYFRKISVNLILDTDLNKHFMLVSKFKGIADVLNMKEENDRLLSLSMCLKAADVAHGTKELSLHKKWSRRIIEEFFIQGDKEAKAGLPVTPMCSRDQKIGKSQQGFLNFVVLPLFEAYDSKFFDEEMRETVTNQIKVNLNYWVEEAEREEKNEPSFFKETSKVKEEIDLELARKK